jgi:hypothetical protein
MWELVNQPIYAEEELWHLREPMIPFDNKEFNPRAADTAQNNCFPLAVNFMMNGWWLKSQADTLAVCRK